MRDSGVVTHARGLGRSGHACWVYDDAEAFAAAARGFLADGLQAGARLMWLSDRPAAELLADAALLPNVGTLIDRGTLEIVSMSDAYAGFSAESQLAFYEGEVARAFADGYTGLRVVGEPTAIASDAETISELVRWEHLADDYMATGSGLSALCAYRRRDLPDDTVRAVAAVHPVVHADARTAPFRLYFDGDRVLLAGELDAFGAGRLARTLAATHLAQGAVTLDLSRLSFIDAAGVGVLADWAGARDAPLRVVDAPPVFARVWGLLRCSDLPHVSVEVRRE